MQTHNSVRKKKSYLRVIVIITNKKTAAATPYIMCAPFNFKDMSIKIEGLLFAFLFNSAKKYLLM